MAETLTAAERLEEINTAISTVLTGGQSYRIGGRSLTRADLSLLRQMQKELKAEVSQEPDTGFFGNTYAAFFDGR